MASYKAPVSVIIPCFKSMETILRAINSILNQSVKPFEIILVDDASGDGTLEFIHKIASNINDVSIRVVALAENSGPGVARNAGWKIASGPYIAFLDADDSWHPNKIKLQYQWMIEHPETVMSGHSTMLIKDGGDLPIVTCLPKSKKIGLYDMLWSNRMVTRSVMLKSDLLYRFEGKKVTEDYLLWLQVIADGLPVVKFDAPLAFSFRPEFSPGGYSGQLWKHEKRELAALYFLKHSKKILLLTFVLAYLWSLVKYVRRVAKLKLVTDLKHD